MVKESYYPLRLKILLATLLTLICQVSIISGQEATYNFFYRVYLKDKGQNHIYNYTASDLFAQKAAERREKYGLADIDFRDIPVYSKYIEQISLLGFKLHCTSRWMNTALFKTETLADLSNVLNLSFVDDVKIVKNITTKSNTYDKLHFDINQEDYLSSDWPIFMLNGQVVHNSGFTGKGILIAVLDGGFENAENISSLGLIRKRDGIKITFDFVKNNENVFDYHNHGTAVLSVLAGNIPGKIAGTAPDADYLLLRTEDTESEFPVEEDFWVAGAEFADSVGADIISSSLGYFTFDDPILNYKYSDMDGNSTFVTRAADIAASKGILIVSSAGNERNKSWKYIISPSDGDSVMAVGAVDANRVISSFSSAGPSYDRRIKPDVVAQGVNVPVQISVSDVQRSSGTSFSCPIISGMCACIIQAVPYATNYDIISSLNLSSDRYLFPDSLYGFGIPDISLTISKLQDKLLKKPDNGIIIYPNPFENEIMMTFSKIPLKLRIEIFDLKGNLITRKDYSDYISRSLRIDEFDGYPVGIYFIRIITETDTFIHKVIRYNR